jgi:ribonuclease D
MIEAPLLSPRRKEHRLAGASPLAEFALIDTQERLAGATDAIARSPIVGLDTEFIGESTYEPELCLVQVSTAEAIYLIDPLARMDLRQFWDVLTAPDREVIAFAARQEMLFCLRYGRRLPGRVFDPQLAAGLVAYPYPTSYGNLVQQALGESLAKGETLTDWRQRPLSRQQLQYAAEDVRHLLPLREHLQARAADMQRLPWFDAEFERQATQIQTQREDPWRRMSGTSSFNRRELAVVRELWTWRDSEARAANLPSRRVLSDDLLIVIAKRAPKTTNELFTLRGLDRPQLRRAGNDLVKAVLTATSLPETELPSLPRRDPAQVGILSSLASILANGLAAQHQVNPQLLATSADIQDFVRWEMSGRQGAGPSLLEGWRGEILGQELRALFEGKRAVRIADLQADNPLKFEAID